MMSLSGGRWHRSLCLAVGVLIAGPALAMVTLHEHDEYRGRSVTVTGRTGYLGSQNFNDMTSSVVVHSGHWQLCDDAEFRGDCVVLAPGRYPSMKSLGMSDRISSIRPVMPPAVPGASIELYEHNQQTGRQLQLTAAQPQLSNEGFNDMASSAIVRSGRWELCADNDFRGRCVVLGPGAYGDLGSQVGMNDQISSLRPTTAATTPGVSGGPVPGLVAPVPAPMQPARPIDDATAPEITFSSNRSARVTYPGQNCIVFFGPGGRRLQSLPVCTAAQVTEADALMGRFRNEYGMNRNEAANPWHTAAAQRPPVPGGDLSQMHMVIDADRQGEVRYRDGCTVLFNALGRRTQQLGACSPEQLRQADDAIAGYRRQLGL